MKAFISVLLMACLIAPNIFLCAEEIVVIAHPHSGIDKLSKDEVINIFLGRYRQLPTGASAQPVDLPAAHSDKARFYRLLVDKDLAEINAYWSRLVFSGRTQPPRAAKGQEDMLNFISKTPGAIGYMDRSLLDGRVMVVYGLGTSR